MPKQRKEDSAPLFSWSSTDESTVPHALGSFVFSLCDARATSHAGVQDAGRASAEAKPFLIEPAGVISSTFEPPRIQTIGCQFSSAPAAKPSGTERRVPMPAFDLQPLPAPTSQPSYTRIRPPKDVIKLEDRLRLLLQPPLESLLAASALRFPFTPFNFQLDGVAFLYPRDRAVLADEMGLGKTMQAVTAIRLLVHQGQLRRVLLVCPKPLVSNWLREFAQWAPELPVAAIEGGPVRRQWQWNTSTDVVTVANYETVVRDRGEVCDAENAYDLVVLDESQRIKNSSSTTNEVVRSIPRTRSWALTGTPIENSVDDLRGIFEFVAPGQLDAKMKPRAVGKAESDFVLRRTKDEVLTD
jgi:SNF2 family DNA or RNA helicase